MLIVSLQEEKLWYITERSEEEKNPREEVTRRKKMNKKGENSKEYG